MKNLLKIIAVMLLFIIPFNSFSTDVPKDNETIKKETTNETELKLENWMTRPLINNIEKPLEIEDWMLKPFIIEDSNNINKYENKIYLLNIKIEIIINHLKDYLKTNI